MLKLLVMVGELTTLKGHNFTTDLEGKRDASISVIG